MNHTICKSLLEIIFLWKNKDNWCCWCSSGSTAGKAGIAVICWWERVSDVLRFLCQVYTSWASASCPQGLHQLPSHSVPCLDGSCCPLPESINSREDNTVVGQAKGRVPFPLSLAPGMWRSLKLSFWHRIKHPCRLRTRWGNTFLPACLMCGVCRGNGLARSIRMLQNIYRMASVLLDMKKYALILPYVFITSVYSNKIED